MTRSRRLLFLVTLPTVLILLCCLAERTRSVSGIEVRDFSGTLIRRILRAEDLRHFESFFFAKRVDSRSQAADFAYQLSVEIDGKTTLWHYDPQGYLAVLSYKMRFVYRVDRPDVFNALLLKAE